MTPSDISAVWITLKLALVSSVILLLLGTAIAWRLSQSQWRLKPVLEALVALPLILPPTVLGFYLLLAFAPDGLLGTSWEWLTGTQLAFSFSGLVIGSIIYSMPFVVQPLQAAFEQLPRDLLEAAATMGAKPLDRFVTIVMPITKRSFIMAASLAFAHTVGEFGVVLMIGGNIPGVTQVVSIALYDNVETMNYTQAHILAGGLLAFSLLLLTVVYWGNRGARLWR